MYDSLRRRSIDGRSAGHEHWPVEFHEGTPGDFLARHEDEARTVALGDRRGRAEFANRLLPRISDERNLKLALDHLAAEGGDAPGPDGMRPRDLGPAERWSMARALRGAFRAGTYRPGRHRVARIPKIGGQGCRIIKIQDIQDRAVQRAILQVLQPFLDPRLADRSLGSRPGKGREQALALAEGLATRSKLWSWTVADVADAFDRVPLGRLMEVLRKSIPADDVLGLIEVVIADRTGKGLRQGGALSPLLLNVYLDHFLDRPWRKAHPEMPLIRVVDDMLLLASDLDRSGTARADLAARLKAAGMPLNPNKGATRDLADGQAIEWLGFDLRAGGSGLELRLAERCWAQLEAHLAGVHDRPHSPIRAIEVIEGWITQAGPCYAHQDTRAACRRVARIARSFALEEIPDEEELKTLWAAGRQSWLRVRDEVGGPSS
ncbi:reverse transcriptase domain-containing protein [Tundrisphaera lichenicola]|uniref:reverse transcriptase domain-containing protein n=1 Tax=Tundrisphaera lichenicola TaxID=2029860 RepID=UPI003EBC151A